MDTILIADNQKIIRQGVRMIIDNYPRKYNIVEATTCSSVIQMLSTEKIQYIILDMFFTDGNIFSAIYRFIEHCHTTRILIYSMSPEKLYARRLMKKGVHGFVSRQAPVKELKEAIQCILKDEIYLSPAITEYLFRPGQAGSPENLLDGLTDRELEVIEYFAAGTGKDQIAYNMQLNVSTINIYRRQACRKLGIKNLIELNEKNLLHTMNG